MHTVLFHLAFPITNLKEAIEFYVEGLGCTAGRRTNQALLLNLYGNQLVGHIVKHPVERQQGVYPRHFGLIFTNEQDWVALLERAQEKGLTFYQQPRRRFPGTPIEHRTFFLEDPFSNLLEFKYYRVPSAIFGQEECNQIGDLDPEECGHT